MQPSEWQRMLIGSGDPLLLAEIAFRTCVMYGYAVLFSRFIGKRGVGQISPFEFVVLIIATSAAGASMFDPSVPLLHGIAVLTVTMLLHRLLGLLGDRSGRVEDLAEGTPVLVVDQGELVRHGVGAATLSHRELLMKLREQGIEDVGEIERAYFEPSGRLSVFRAGPGRRRATLSRLPGAPPIR